MKSAHNSGLCYSCLALYPPKPVPAPMGAGTGLIVARRSIVKLFRSLPLNYTEQLKYYNASMTNNEDRA